MALTMLPSSTMALTSFKCRISRFILQVYVSLAAGLSQMHE
jgi:hypothetical protein